MSDEHLTHLLNTDDTPLAIPVFVGVSNAVIADYDIKEVDGGAILTVKLQVQDPIQSVDGKDFPAGHIITKQIRFIPSGKWTIDSAKQELRKLQIAALNKPFSTTEALPPFNEENKSTYVGSTVQAILRTRASKNADGEPIQYQDCRFKAAN